MRRIDLNNANVAHTETVGGINRQIVLNYVREREPISRALLAQETALQRSTISRIVDGLIAKGWSKKKKESPGRTSTHALRLRAPPPWPSVWTWQRREPWLPPATSPAACCNRKNSSPIHAPTKR